MAYSVAVTREIVFLKYQLDRYRISIADLNQLLDKLPETNRENEQYMTEASVYWLEMKLEIHESLTRFEQEVETIEIKIKDLHMSHIGGYLRMNMR